MSGCNYGENIGYFCKRFASEDVTVELFLEEKISFLDIEKIVTDAVREHDSRTKSNMENDFTIEDIIKTDIEVKERIKEVYK